MEWILIYSSVPLTFHVITNTDSIPYVERVFERVNASTQLTFDHHIVTLASIMERMTNEICPQLGISSEDFCDVLMGKMTPLLFPFLFPDLNHVIYVDRNIRFQDDIGALFHVLVEVMGPTSAALAVAPEQTNLYMRAFSTWQRINPTTRLGRPPPEGRPGLNPDLILLDLRKLRTNTTYKVRCPSTMPFQNTHIENNCFFLFKDLLQGATCQTASEGLRLSHRRRNPQPRRSPQPYGGRQGKLLPQSRLRVE